MKYLLVVAHPDDETLGAGASMWKWAHSGDTVDVCIMCTEAKARAFRPEDNELEDDTNASNKFLGVNRIYEGTFPNIEMNTVPHLKLVQFIESAIRESDAAGLVDGDVLYLLMRQAKASDLPIIRERLRAKRIAVEPVNGEDIVALLQHIADTGDGEGDVA